MQGRSEGIPANLFSLSGDSINVEYGTGTPTGSSLAYRGAQLNRSFANEELTVENTLLGQLVTVTLRQIPDLETVTFTLVLPSITLTEHNAPPVDIEVPGITTTHSTTIAGSELGQQTFYSVVTLVGTAEAAVFSKNRCTPTAPKRGGGRSLPGRSGGRIFLPGRRIRLAPVRKSRAARREWRIIGR